MIDAEFIYKKANSLVKQFGTNDPYGIAEGLGIIVDDTSDLNSLLGVFTYKWKHRIIMLHTRLCGHLRIMTGAHELGHAVLHIDEAKQGALKEFSMFKLKTKTEYEANAFAAHLLIDDDDLLELAYSGYTVEQMASILEVFPQLVAIKIKEMIKLGYDLILPCDIDSCFLKDINIDDYLDDNI